MGENNIKRKFGISLILGGCIYALQAVFSILALLSISLPYIGLVPNPYYFVIMWFRKISSLLLFCILLYIYLSMIQIELPITAQREDINQISKIRSYYITLMLFQIGIIFREMGSYWLEAKLASLDWNTELLLRAILQCLILISTIFYILLWKSIKKSQFFADVHGHKRFYFTTNAIIAGFIIAVLVNAVYICYIIYPIIWSYSTSQFPTLDQRETIYTYFYHIYYILSSIFTAVLTGCYLEFGISLRRNVARTSN